MPEYRPDQCEGNIKTCPPDRGGCGYRFLKTDPKWQAGGVCPKCGRDRRCERSRVIGVNVCQVHGAGSVKKGRVGGNISRLGHIRAKSMPKQLRQGYQAYLKDGRLLELQTDIATLRARTDDLIKRSEAEGADQLWPKALEAFKQLRKADRRGSYEEKVKWETELQSILEAGTNEYLRWEEIRNNIELTRRLTVSENRRLVEADQMISRKQLMVFIAALIQVIESNVTDTKTKSAIGFGIQRLLALGETTQQAIDSEVVDVTPS